jgi:hypothetical protein
VERLAKMNEAVDEEASAVNHGLAVIEHAVEVRWFVGSALRLLVASRRMGAGGAPSAAVSKVGCLWLVAFELTACKRDRMKNCWYQAWLR